MEIELGPIVAVQEAWGVPIATFGVVAGAVVCCRVVQLVLARSLRVAADRRLAGRSGFIGWRTRLPRAGEGAQVVDELRHRRIDAAARAMSRIVAVMICLTAAVLILHLHDIAVGHALSGAGFLGLVVAFSAQHSVNDYVTGLHVLLEDRYGEGDEIEVIALDGHSVRGVVVSLGAFATRIQSTTAIHHVANRLMGEVANHSQLSLIESISGRNSNRVDSSGDEPRPAQRRSLRPARRLRRVDGHLPAGAPATGADVEGLRR